MHMAHIDPVPRDELPQFEDYFRSIEATAGYIPNAFLTMAHHPGLLEGYIAFSNAIRALNSVPFELKILMSHLSSSAVACRFCEAHTGKTALTNDVDPAKIAGVWEFESSPLFSDAERAALRLARDMVQVPNAVTKTHFDDLRQFFDDKQIVEMVMAVAQFGVWNRWNDTMATDLEEPVIKVAEALLAPRGWSGDKHIPAVTGNG
jgi:alkylhydroperoxidase family enzyme